MRVIVIDSRVLTRFAARVVPAAVLLLGFGSTVDAASPSFQPGEPLSASKMNASFAEHEARLTKVESRLSNGGRYAMPGLYCKATTIPTSGDLSALGTQRGYAGTRAPCQAACGTPTAHMCSGEEVVRSAALGTAIPTGWFIAGFNIYSVNTYVSDCDGFTTATAVSGTLWKNNDTGAWASNAPCSHVHPLLCCDAP